MDGRIRESAQSRLDGTSDVDVFEASGRYAAVTAHEDDALQLINISNPSSPFPISYVQHSSAFNGAVGVYV